MFFPRLTFLLLVLLSALLPLPRMQAASPPEMEYSEGPGDCDEIAYFTYQSQGFCNPCVLQFQSYAPPGLTHFWDFGDGSNSNLANPLHQYSVSGTYVVIHLVTVQGPGGVQIINKCLKTITVNCNNQVNIGSHVECGRLILEASACSEVPAGCQASWAILVDSVGDSQAPSIVCATASGTSAVFYLDNLNTYAYPTVTLQYVIACTGSPASINSYTYTIPADQQGIYVNVPLAPPGADDFYNIGTQSCINHLQPLFEHATTIAGRNVYITGILVLSYPTNDQLLFFNDSLYFAGGSGMNSLKKFEFNKCQLRNACNLSWRGFEIYGLSNMQGYVKNCDIRGADYALRIMNDVHLQVKNTDFSANYVAVMAQVPFDPDIQNCTFLGSPALLPPGGSILPTIAESGPYSTGIGFAGLYLENFEDTKQNDPLHLVAEFNTFSSLANGIYLKNSTATLRQNQFYNCDDNGNYPSAIGADNGVFFMDQTGEHRLRLVQNVMSTNPCGVRAVTMGPGSEIDFHGNTGGNNFRSYLLEQKGAGNFALAQIYGNTTRSKEIGIGYSYEGTGAASSIQINNNTLEVVGGDGVKLSGQNPGTDNILVSANFISLLHPEARSGIHLVNFKGALISNTFGKNIVDIQNFNNLDNYGIWLESSPNNKILNNLVTGIYCVSCQSYFGGVGLLAESSTGNAIEGNIFKTLGHGFEFRGNCSMSGKLKCNTMNQTGYGMQFGESPQNPIGFIGAQNSTGNRWADPQFLPGSLLIGAVNYGDQSQLDASLFHTAQGSSQEYPQTFELQAPLDPSSWFLPGVQKNCAPAPFISEESDDRSSAAQIEAEFVPVLSPNPADDQIRLSFDNVPGPIKGEVQLWNAIGQLVLEMRIEENETNIPLQQVPNGIYLCRILRENAEPMHKMVQVEHR